MNITGMGTISSHIKNVNLNMKWQERKQNPLKDKELDPQTTEIKRWSEDQRHSQTISSIHSKMLAGKELTKEELDYLEETNPEMYKQAVQIEKERNEYKKELSNCKSREDVEKLNQRKLQQFAAEAKVISNNPNIPKGKKDELLEFLTMRINAVMNDHAKYIKSNEYYQLSDKTDKTDRTYNSAENVMSKDEIDSETDIENKTDDSMKVVSDLLTGVSDSASASGQHEAVNHTAAGYNSYIKRSDSFAPEKSVSKYA